MHRVNALKPQFKFLFKACFSILVCTIKRLYSECRLGGAVQGSLVWDPVRLFLNTWELVSIAAHG